MNRFGKISLLLFCLFILVVVVFQYCVDLDVFSNRIIPWHMDKGDSLSESYLEKYEITDQQRLIRKLTDSSRIWVLVLVDAWGVPYEESLLKDEFEIFGTKKSKKFLHKRLTEFTKYAENAEFRLESGEGLYLFGGDSLEYARSSYLDSLGYHFRYFCQKCDDEIMLGLADSILSNSDTPRVIALTTQSSRGGDRDSLLHSLKMISKLVEKYPEVTFVIQGTHRPILCKANVREQYYQHWVPAILVNAE